jgi:hypothetical protein
MFVDMAIGVSAKALHADRNRMYFYSVSFVHLSSSTPRTDLMQCVAAVFVRHQGLSRGLGAYRDRPCNVNLLLNPVERSKRSTMTLIRAARVWQAARKRESMRRHSYLR